MLITSILQARKHLDNTLDDQADDKDKHLANFFKLLFTAPLTTSSVGAGARLQAQLPPPHPDLRARSEQSAKLEQLAKRWWNWRSWRRCRTFTRSIWRRTNEHGDLSHLPYTHFLVNVAQKGAGVTSSKHVNTWWQDISSRPCLGEGPGASSHCQVNM